MEQLMTMTINELMADNAKTRNADAWRRYRALVGDAASAEQIDAEHADDLSAAAAAVGVDQSVIARHVGAVNAHRKHLTRLEELRTEVPAAIRKRKTLAAELDTLNGKVRTVSVAIQGCRRPEHEQAHVSEMIRRIETKHAAIFNTEVV